MSQYPTLCMLSYDRELPTPQRSPRSPRRVGSAGPSPRQDRSATGLNYGYLSVRQGVKAVTEEYTTPHRLSLNSSPKVKTEPARRHTSQLTQSLTSPRYDLPVRAQTEKTGLREKKYSDDFKLPVLRCGGAGETSLTVNAEMLQDPKWNEYLNAWVSGKQDGCRAYLNIAKTMSLIDRGILHYLPEFEHLPSIPCPRFWKHMHHEKAPQPPAAEPPKKKVIKKPEFWSWKGRTAPKIPSLKAVVKKPAHCCRYCCALRQDIVSYIRRDNLSTVEEETLSALANEDQSLLSDEMPSLSSLSSEGPVLSKKEPNLSSLPCYVLSSNVRSLPPLSPSFTAIATNSDSRRALSSDDDGRPFIHLPTIRIPTADDAIRLLVETVIEEPEPDEKDLPEVDEEPSDYGSIQSDFTELHTSFVSASTSTSVPIKTPPNLFRLTTPPKSASTAVWEEHSYLSDSAIDSWADRDPMSPLEPLDIDLDMFFTNEYIEVLEPVEWGCVEPRDSYHEKKLKDIITNPGVAVTVVPPLPLEEKPFQPDKIEDVDRVTIHNAPPVVMQRPEIPKPPPPPKEPTPPPPRLPTPPPTPKPKRKPKPIVKKTRKVPPKPKPLTPVPEPEPVKEPTPELPPLPQVKMPTPVPPTPVEIPPTLPPPEPPPPRLPTPPPPKEPTPQPPVIEIAPEPPKSPTPEPPESSPTPEPEKEPSPLLPPEVKFTLPPPQKDLDFLAEIERERLAEERRLKALQMFEKLRKKMSFPTVQMDEVVSVTEYGWLPKFCIVKEVYKPMYKAAFDTVDENKDGYLNCFETMLALKGITGLQNMTEKEEEYVYRVLEVADYNIAFGTDFRLFCVIASLAQKVASIDEWVKNLIKKMDLQMLDWKMYRAKELFQWCLDEQTNQLSVKKLMIELKAGGVSQEHQDEAKEKFGERGTLDLLDFLTYLPLFIMTHQSVVDNPLDNTRDK